MTKGQRIRCRRKEKGYTLEYVANILNLTRQTLSRYETGVIPNIPSNAIEGISKVLDTTPAYIMGWNDTAEKVGSCGISLETRPSQTNMPANKVTLNQKDSPVILVNSEPSADRQYLVDTVMSAPDDTVHRLRVIVEQVLGERAQ